VGGMVVIVVGVNCIFEFKVGNLRSFVHVRRGWRVYRPSSVSICNLLHVTLRP
jgi:hypothetical protein